MSQLLRNATKGLDGRSRQSNYANSPKEGLTLGRGIFWPDPCFGFVRLLLPKWPQGVIIRQRRQGDRLSDDATDNSRSGGWAAVASFPQSRIVGPVAFDRLELQAIMGLYGRMVAAGEWRDYAMDFLKDRAIFSIYRRTSEMPLYRIEKNPELRNKQGMYAVHAPGGLIMKRGQDLTQVLRVIDKPVRMVAF
jgi:Protein of unknown function (DUF2794)